MRNWWDASAMNARCARSDTDSRSSSALKALASVPSSSFGFAARSELAAHLRADGVGLLRHVGQRLQAAAADGPPADDGQQQRHRNPEQQRPLQRALFALDLRERRPHDNPVGDALDLGRHRSDADLLFGRAGEHRRFRCGDDDVIRKVQGPGHPRAEHLTGRSDDGDAGQREVELVEHVVHGFDRRQALGELVAQHAVDRMRRRHQLFVHARELQAEVKRQHCERGADEDGEQHRAVPQRQARANGELHADPRLSGACGRTITRLGVTRA